MFNHNNYVARLIITNGFNLNDYIDYLGNFFNNGKLIINPITGSEYVPIYKDKDGDWMMIGDVPWKYVIYVYIQLYLYKSTFLKIFFL